MNTEQKIEELFGNLRKVLFYVGHGKYNDLMTLEEVLNIKETLEKILDLEKEYKLISTDEEKEDIYKRISIFKEYSIRDFAKIKLAKV
ncbi:MAG: hypothetical protein HRT40_02820 [Campylobacteraceae bacterium]|nr:hypothetical protein [Campylobacteraceae bacterium]